jgi:hypothetical protein
VRVPEDEGCCRLEERPMLSVACVLNCGKAASMLEVLKSKLRGFPTGTLSLRIGS